MDGFFNVYFKDKYTVVPGVVAPYYVYADPTGSFHKQCIELMEYLIEFNELDCAYDTFRLYPSEDPQECYFELFYQGLSMGSWFVDVAAEFDSVRDKEYPYALRCYRELG
jgi:hypothetical protein